MGLQREHCVEAEEAVLQEVGRLTISFRNDIPLVLTIGWKWCGRDYGPVEMPGWQEMRLAG